MPLVVSLVMLVLVITIFWVAAQATRRAKSTREQLFIIGKRLYSIRKSFRLKIEEMFENSKA